MVKLLSTLGVGFDCATRGELAKINEICGPGQSIVLANPTKPIIDLEFAKEIGVDTMTVDSELELYKLKKHYPNAK